MVTVASSLDIPIKLVFPGPKRGSMLGLGDIVLPGIMIALALRFDLYLYYLRKPAPPATSHSLTPSASPKPTYEPASSHWGERYWTAYLPTSKIPSEVAATRFPKVYFTASLIGYTIGMLTTLVVLNAFSHAQPALLYLVPGVLGALWGTALCRGELKLMWEYTEADDEKDEKEKDKKNGSKKEEAKAGSSSDKSTEIQNDLIKEDLGLNKTGEEKGAEEKEDKEKDQKKQKEVKSIPVNEHAHHVFLFSLSASRKGPKKSKFLEAMPEAKPSG
jgi:minor histocompatibility antigen H13